MKNKNLQMMYEEAQNEVLVLFSTEPIHFLKMPKLQSCPDKLQILQKLYDHNFDRTIEFCEFK